jgi:hypothetical protein
LFHQPQHNLLRDGDALPCQRSLQPAVTVATVVQFEDVGDGLPQCKVLVCHLHTGSMVKVRAPRQIQLSKELWQGIELFEGVNQQCLLPIGALPHQKCSLLLSCCLM